MARTNGNGGTTNQVSGWVGWVYFAGFMMIVMGVLQAIAGIAALFRNTIYVIGERGLLAFNLTTWGWMHLLLGIVIVMAGSAVVDGRTWGRVVGVILAILSLVANFAFLSAYPVWSIVMMVIDVIVIFALTVHGAEVRE